MSDKLTTFTSTGHKLLRHGDLLFYWNRGVPTPQSLQVALTENCTLNCKFCSVVNRPKKYVFDYTHLLDATKMFIKTGTKTVEITGGGDPLLYPELNQYLKFLSENNIKIGLITNGIGINKLIDKSLLNTISWIRISSNVLDYRDEIEIPEGFTGTLGFSYCYTEGITTKDQLLRIKQVALENGVRYIRVVPNCLSSHEQLGEQHKILGPLVEELGEPFFYQAKQFSTPKNCYWGYVKPFLYCDEYIYPCSSTVLNTGAEKQFNESFRWCHYTEIEKIWENSSVESILDTKRCDHCVFSDQNEMLNYALHEQEQEEFI